MGYIFLQYYVVSKRLSLQLAAFLRRERGEQTLAQFAKQLGISDSSLHRLEMGEQNITLDTLEEMTKRLKCRLGDLFPEEYPGEKRKS